MRLLVFILGLFFATSVFAGYDFHITRKANWFDQDGPCIKRNEWLAYVGSDKQVKQDKNNSQDDFLVSLPEGVFPLWYNPQLCEIYTKNPSPAAISKLKDIAKRLRAKVQGDDGEVYPLKP